MKKYLVVFADKQRPPIIVKGKGKQSVSMQVFGFRVAKAVLQCGLKSITEIKLEKKV
jgi:hypothetical protein